MMDNQIIIMLVQTIIFLITAFSAFILYRIKHVSSIRVSANIIILQIKYIEKNIKYIKSEGINSEIISEQAIFNSTQIYDKNYWDKYKHQLFKYINQDDYNIISDFYDNASAIKHIQLDVKNFILYSLQAKAINYYNFAYKDINIDNCHGLNELPALILDSFNRVSPLTYIPKHYSMYLSNYLNLYSPLTGTATYEKLITLSHKKYFLIF